MGALWQTDSSKPVVPTESVDEAPLPKKKPRGRFVWRSFWLLLVIILIVVVSVVGPGMGPVIVILGLLYGIGGSRMNQAADLFVDHLAIPFKPRAVILYEGSNDINAGAKPEEVLANFRKLYGKLHAALPQARLYVLGVVPSPGKRFLKIAELRKTNELLAKECATQPWMKFIDITEPLIGADGQPKAECFIPGDIHMLPAGYAVWKSVIAPVIVPAEKPFEHAQ